MSVIKTARTADEPPGLVDDERHGPAIGMGRRRETDPDERRQGNQRDTNGG